MASDDACLLEELLTELDRLEDPAGRRIGYFFEPFFVFDAGFSAENGIEPDFLAELLQIVIAD